MNKTANINIRIDPETKRQAEELYEGLGISITAAVTIFLRMSILKGGLPFELKYREPGTAVSSEGEGKAV